MDNVWLWICELPNSSEWSVSGSNTFIFPLVTSNNNQSPKSKTATDDDDQLTIHLKAERTTESSSDDFLTFSINLCKGETETTTLWKSSDKCPISSDTPNFLPLILQLLQELIDLTSIKESSTSSSTSHTNPTLKPDSLKWILTTHTNESLSNFFTLIFLTRLFWLCAFNAPTEVGFLYFHSIIPSDNLNLILHLSNHRTPILRTFFISVGIDIERSIARAVGYMLVKCLIMKEMRVGLLPSFSPPIPLTNAYLGLAYATEAHGLWILKSHTPIWAMRPTRSGLGTSPFLVNANESALRYSLAHQQLEAVIQLEYTVKFHDEYIQLITRVDNIRLHLIKLAGFHNKNEEDHNPATTATSSSSSTTYTDELYFPSRIQVSTGPEPGSTYISSLTLGKSTGDTKRELETERVVKGNLGTKLKSPKIKATSRTSTRTKVESWRWDQESDGNTIIYDGVLHDPVTGAEVYKLDGSVQTRHGLRKRYVGGNRLFTKSGGLVIEGGECGMEVKWRLKKEMEGSVVKWRVGGKVWLSYWPCEVQSKCFETRCFEVWDEVDLPIIRRSSSSITISDINKD